MGQTAAIPDVFTGFREGCRAVSKSQLMLGEGQHSRNERTGGSHLKIFCKELRQPLSGCRVCFPLCPVPNAEAVDGTEGCIKALLCMNLLCRLQCTVFKSSFNAWGWTNCIIKQLVGCVGLL